MHDQDKTREQLLAELADLRQREAQWRSAMANVPNFISIVDRAGTIQFLNRTQPGTTVAEAIGKKVFDFTQPEHHGILRSSLEQVFEAGKPGYFESRGSGPNGSYVWYETYFGPIKVDGRVVAASIIANDITERRQAGETLRQERNRAQQYLDVAAVIMLVLDEEGRVTLLNRKGYEILEYHEKDLLGEHWFDTCVPERVRNDVLVAFQQLMAGELEPVEHFENPVLTRSGEERTIAWHTVRQPLDAAFRHLCVSPSDCLD